LLIPAPQLTQVAGESDDGFKERRERLYHLTWAFALKDVLEQQGLGFALTLRDGASLSAEVVVTALSADGEEQDRLFSLRGPKSEYVCAVCLTPKAALLDFNSNHPRRTALDFVDHYQRAQGQSAAEKNRIMLEISARHMLPSLLLLSRRDCFSCLRPDVLHELEGLVGKHVWPAIVSFTLCGKTGNKPSEGTRPSGQGITLHRRLNAAYQANFPRAAGLSHFTGNLTSVNFTDGKHHADLMLSCGVSVSAALGDEPSARAVIDRLVTTLCRILLCERFELWTPARYSFAQQLVSEIPDLLEVRHLSSRIKRGSLICEQRFGELREKNWRFPKSHKLTHLFESVSFTGILGKFSTRIGEGVHPLLKAAFRLTNHRDPLGQIIKRTSAGAEIARLAQRNRDIEAAAAERNDSRQNELERVTTEPLQTAPPHQIGNTKFGGARSIVSIVHLAQQLRQRPDMTQFSFAATARSFLDAISEDRRSAAPLQVELPVIEASAQVNGLSTLSTFGAEPPSRSYDTTT
jgi:hypothetical protein